MKEGTRRRSWTHEQLAEGFDRFYNEFGRYPTGPEVDRYPHLPSARTIEIRFGGLPALRRQLGIGGQEDYRTGEHSSARARSIAQRAHENELKAYSFLCGHFGKEFVHREYFFTDDARTRADFFVYDVEKCFCVDAFYPKDRRNLAGCLNSKLLKYTEERMQQYPVIFLQMNDEIPQGVMDELIQNKLKKLAKGQYLMGWDAFVAFCKGRRPR